MDSNVMVSWEAYNNNSGIAKITNSVTVQLVWFTVVDFDGSTITTDAISGISFLTQS